MVAEAASLAVVVRRSWWALGTSESRARDADVARARELDTARTFLLKNVRN